MATLFFAAGFRFFYRSFDFIMEPCHVHVTDGGRKLCKYWITEEGLIFLADTDGFKRSELKKIERALLRQMPLIQANYEADCTDNQIETNYYAGE